MVSTDAKDYCFVGVVIGGRFLGGDDLQHDPLVDVLLKEIDELFRFGSKVTLYGECFEKAEKLVNGMLPLTKIF
jgi:hypothetical protein